MNRLIFILFVAAADAPAQSVPVPSTYQDLYSTLTTQISTFDSAVRANWDGTPSPVVYAPQLETASAALYTELIGANFTPNAVLPELEDLQPWERRASMFISVFRFFISLSTPPIQRSISNSSISINSSPEMSMPGE